MNFVRHNSNSQNLLRRGSAPLEMVLITPLLVAMFVLVLYVGNFMIGQAYVVTQARNEAWHKRYTEAESKEYDFEGPAGFVDGESSQERRISNLVRLFPSPKSKHLVIGDAWHASTNSSLPKADQRAQELNKHWNLKLQIELAKLAGDNTIDQALTELNGLKSLADRIMNIIRDKIAELLNPFKSDFDRFETEAEEVKRKLEEKREAAKQQARNRIQAIDQEIKQIDDEIRAKENQVRDIEKQIEDSKALDDDDDEKLTAAEIKELEERKEKIEDVDIPQLKKDREAKQRERELQRQILEQLNA